MRAATQTKSDCRQHISLTGPPRRFLKRSTPRNEAQADMLAMCPILSVLITCCRSFDVSQAAGQQQLELLLACGCQQSKLRRLPCRRVKHCLPSADGADEQVSPGARIDNVSCKRWTMKVWVAWPWSQNNIW
jgi:hypothetical protein